MGNNFKVVTKEKESNGKTKICMHGAIKSFHLYNHFISAVTEYMYEQYKKAQLLFLKKKNISTIDEKMGDLWNEFVIEEKKKRIAPIISFFDVTWLDSSVAPLLLSISSIMKDYYSEPIPFIHPCKDSVKSYLMYSHFNSLALGLSNNIDDRDRMNENAFLTFNKNDATLFQAPEKVPNKKNILKIYKPRLEYYDAVDPEEYKHIIQEICFLDVRNSNFYDFLKTKLGQTDELDDSIIIISELMCNAILYSLSDLIVNVQMKDAHNYYFTLCDTGIGFLESLQKKRKNTKMLNLEYLDLDPLEAKENACYKSSDKRMEEFYAFFTAIKHPGKYVRYNLKKLIQIITRANGTIRIHMDYVLLSFFGSDNFYSNNENVYDWMNHIINGTINDYTRSPLYIFKNRVQGVHIEVIFEDRKEGINAQYR